MFRSVYDSKVGPLTVDGDQNGLIRIWLPNMHPTPVYGPCGPLPWGFGEQLTSYLSGNRKDWNLPYTLIGTPFQLAVWAACKEIPYGATVSYQELAIKIGNPAACRAVGHALAVNPLPLIIPCHRVLPSNHSLGNFAGGVLLKKHLLSIERT